MEHASESEADKVDSGVEDQTGAEADEDDEDDEEDEEEQGKGARGFSNILLCIL
jgi:hypothetical protein